MKSNFKNILVALLIALVFIGIGFVFGTTHFKFNGDKVQVIYNLIKSEYEGSLDQDALSENLLNGLGSEYSYYLNSETYQKSILEDQGKYVGIGMIYSFENGIIKVLEVFDNTPASSSGILKGDFVVKINNIEATSLKNQEEAINFFRGADGEEINLVIKKSSDNNEKEVRVKRTVLQLPTLNLKDLGDGLYYLKIYRFQENTPDEFNQAFKDINPENLQNLIIDLRNNFGGNTEASLFIDKQFVEKGVLIKEVHKNKKEVVTNADGSAKYKDTKIVILVNKETASAAEQMASALRDNNRAKIIGEATYGKGVFGNTFELKDGSAIHITTGHWLRPNGETIQSGGIKPDMEIQDVIIKNQDVILDRAIEYLQN